MHAPRVLIVPGLGNSGPAHWQTLWETQHGYARVNQHDWERPRLDAWLAQLEAVLAEQPSPVVLAAHSLGTILVAHLAARARPGQIAAALLVAPADVDDDKCTPEETRTFAPVPLARLHFRTTLVASRNDPYVTFERAVQFAAAWGARLVDAGAVGHINADSGLGHWPAGHELLQELYRS
jgi:predicted alpha/beta hydrolase family esterase